MPPWRSLPSASDKGLPTKKNFGADFPFKGCIPAATLKNRLGSRVARWFVFIPKIPIRVYFGVLWNGKYSSCYTYILYHHFEHFTAVWYILFQIGIVCSHLVYFSKFLSKKIWQKC
jgi:hypothetical protein